MPLSPGTVLNNRYRIASLLGQGGFGAVYRAWDLRLEIPIALKENLSISEAGVSQFNTEAKILVSLNHPNLPRVLDFFSENASHFLVMDYIEGSDVATLGMQPVNVVLNWADQICDAINYLHTLPKPVIHRDIKPDNIRLTANRKPYLVDFGISKVSSPGMGTQTGARGFTPGYAPVEQYGYGGTDARTDIYSLGATLYFALSGMTPPESVQRLSGAPVAKLTGVPQHVVEAIEKAMEIKAEGRFQSIEDFRLVLSGGKKAQLTPAPANAPPVVTNGKPLTLRERIEQAEPGSEIIIEPGIYNESFEITKPIKLRGKGPAEQIIIRPGKQIKIDAINCAFSGMTFFGNYAHPTVEVSAGTHVFENCRFSNSNGIGLLVANAISKVTVRECVFSGSRYGVVSNSGAHCEVQFSIFESNQVAISCTSSEVMIKNCDFKINLACIHTLGLSRMNISKSTLQSSGAPRVTAIYTDGAPDVEISDCVISGMYWVVSSTSLVTFRVNNSRFFQNVVLCYPADTVTISGSGNTGI